MEITENTNDWNVLYTYPKHEKKVVRNLQDKGIEAYVPLHRVARKWSDRIKKVEVPLFPGYVFTRLPFKNRHRLFDTGGIIKMILSNDQPACVSNKVIADLRKIIENGVVINSEVSLLQEGKEVRIVDGPFAGLEGTIMRNKKRIVIKIESIHQCISIDAETFNLEPVVKSSYRK
jgi:transcription antitermination factor NusG